MRRRFFDDARGSAAEWAACLDALVAKGVCTDGRVNEGKALLYRIVSMLTKLINRFAPATAVREEVVPYNSDKATEDEYEDNYEDDK